ncbi:unnamed protein product, partial [Coregonus sp. 'balchen']
RGGGERRGEEERGGGERRGEEERGVGEEERGGGNRRGEEERGGGERRGEEERGVGEEERGGGERRGEEERGGGEVRRATTEEHPSVSEEASDSCRTDSRFMTSISSDSLDALEEDDLIACSSSLPHPPFRLTVEPPHPQPHPRGGASSPRGGAGEWRGGGGRRGGGGGRRSGNGAGVDPHYSPMTPDPVNSERVTPVAEEEEGGGGGEEEQGAVLTLEPVPILQPPPGFGDSSSDEEFFDARDRFASPEDPTSGTVSRDFSAEMASGMAQQTVSLSDIRINLTEGGSDEREEGREGETTEEEKEDEAERCSPGSLGKDRRNGTDFTSTVSYPGPDQNQERNWDWNPDHVPDQYPDRVQNRTESSDESQLLSLDPEPSEQSQNPCPTVSSLSHTEGEAFQLESKPILTKPTREGSHQGPGDPRAPDNPKAELHRSSRSRRKSMETEPDVMESKSVTALVTAASSSITAVRCRVEPDGKESTDRRGDGEEGEMEEEEGGGEAGAGPFTCHMFLTEIKEEEGERGEELGEEGERDRERRQPSLISEGPPSVRGSQFSRRPLCLTKDEGQEAYFIPQISISHPGVYGRDIGGEQDVAGGEESVTPLPAPPPPTSPLPPLPAPSIPHTERGERDSEDVDVGSQPKPFTLSDREKDNSCLTQVHRKLTISHQDLTSIVKAEN